MMAMTLIHLCFGGDSPLGYVKNKVLLILFWEDFSQYISKYMALKV